MPRKTWPLLVVSVIRPEASMRPRPDAAENVTGSGGSLWELNVLQ